MSELGVLQRKMPLMLAKLIIFTYEKGYEITLGEGYNAAGIGHMKGSVHYVKLGQDLNLFKDGNYLAAGVEAEKGHNLLHDEWDRLGGAKRIAKDLNHYSLEWQGRR